MLSPSAPFSMFAQWQASKRFASLEELELMHPGTLELFGFNEAPPAQVLIYSASSWIVLTDFGLNRSHYELHIESQTYCSESLKELELILFSWIIDPIN